MTTPSFRESHISQIPALQVLQNLGYVYLTPEDALTHRGGKEGNVILEDVLTSQINKLNTIEIRGESFKFSPGNIYHAVRELKEMPFEGLLQTNAAVYDLLSLGKSFEETLFGNTRSYSLHYVDWKYWENNVFHVTAEFSVERSGSHKTRRPDIILFVNGIPFGVIECKPPVLPDAGKEPIAEAISQMVRNQRPDNIPKLFFPAQILGVLSKNEASFGTVGTPKKFWAKWREETKIEKNLSSLINQPLIVEQKNKLFTGEFAYTRAYFDALEYEPREVTEQDRALYHIFRPDRLLDLARNFIVFEAGEKKIARYQQFFSVKNVLKRVKEFDGNGVRNGGVIWHTQGSGKSLTMVMMARAIATDPNIPNSKIIIVTDRVELDDNISDTFRFCGKEVIKAKTGNELLKLIQGDQTAVVTTIINKFMAAVKRRNFKNMDPNVFVMVDEAHRTQYEELHAIMRKVLPNACYLGFTGTPIRKKDRNTYARFGGTISGCNYTIKQALDDKAVVPLLYEGRIVDQYVAQDEIDNWFHRVSEPLSDKQVADLKRKFSSTGQVNKSDQRLHMVAWDISKHFQQMFQMSGENRGFYKGQLAVAGKAVAVRYKDLFDEIGIVSTEVLISPPDQREGYEEAFGESDDAIQHFWKKMMDKYHTPENYDKSVRKKFKSSENPEIIIVVAKLLTGFDAPRNTVLYIDKKLEEHNLLQAIARVNRLYDGKDFGYIIDYKGVLKELDKAITDIDVLADYDAADLEGAFSNVSDIVDELPQRHADVHDIFKSLPNKMDEEAYERYLGDEKIRFEFYEKLLTFSKTLKIALASADYLIKTPDGKITTYKKEKIFYEKLRLAVKRRYAEVVDFSHYESQIKNLIDRYVTSDSVDTITNLVSIFDEEEFDKEIESVLGMDAKADTIAYRTKVNLDGIKMDDPYFYKKFSKLLKDTINAYRQERIDATKYLNDVKDIMNRVRLGRDRNIPDRLINKDIPRAFYGWLNEIFTNESVNGTQSIAVDAAIKIDEIILQNRIVDWSNNRDIQNKIKNDIEDYLLDMAKENQMNLSFDRIDEILEEILKIATHRYAD